MSTVTLTVGVAVNISLSIMLLLLNYCCAVVKLVITVLVLLPVAYGKFTPAPGLTVAGVSDVNKLSIVNLC